MQGRVDHSVVSLHSSVCLLSVEWPVRRPTRTLMSRLLSFKTDLENCLFGPYKCILACLQNGIVLQDLRCSLVAHSWASVRTVVAGIPTAGSGLKNSEWAARLASASAASLPSTPKCPGTQSRRMLLKTDNSCSFATVSATRLEVIFGDWSAFNAAYQNISLWTDSAVYEVAEHR